MTNPPDAAVDVNGKTLTGGLARPHSRVDSIWRKLFHRRRRFIDLTPEQKQIVLSIKK